MDELSKLYNISSTDLALSFSRISDYSRNGAKALNKPRQELTSEGVKIGSYVDDLLLNKKNIKKLYYFYNGDKPTANLLKLSKIILDNYKRTPSNKTILKIIQKNNLWPRWSENKLLKTFNNPIFFGYLKAMYASRNKMLLTKEDSELGQRLVYILQTHEYSKYIFQNSLTHCNQYKFNINYKGFYIRGFIDKILIDHKNKTVRLIDLKTGKGHIAEFMDSFLKWKYYLQSAIYTLAFKHICETLNLEGYKLLPFQFLYISTSEMIPLLFTVTSKWQKASFLGFETKKGYKYRGLNKLLDEIKWHMDNKVFHTTKTVHESNGIMLLDDNFITVNNNGENE